MTEVSESEVEIENAYIKNFDREYGSLKINITVEPMKSFSLNSRAFAIYMYTIHCSCTDSLIKARALSFAPQEGVGQFGMLVLENTELMECAKQDILLYNFKFSLFFFERLNDLLGKDKITAFKIQENDALINKVSKLSSQFELLAMRNNTYDASTILLIKYYTNILERITDLLTKE